MSIFEPSKLLIQTELEHEAIPKVELFNKRLHSRKLEAWCAAKFGVGYCNHVEKCLIEIEEIDEQREYDFKLHVNSRIELIQLVEVMDSGRKRGLEYKQEGPEQISAKLLEGDGYTSSYGLTRIRDVLGKKVEKHYADSKGLIVLLYLNMMAMQVEHEVLKENLLDLTDNFKEVWLISGKHIGCLSGHEFKSDGFKLIGI
ncbi:hypothetical protein [Cognaticolwellia beringensis]|uniref:Uncharacterized protein n=1 Tax=Cognaticolwellia beringensis TaxID=1967665 RepID=A0A222GDJ9_9GAMM|nr:hypothetical protein [Cognaticolwellia beringensis]ASP49454.1 hypothetical protein B5D82_17750 [Cognaticolwellia beringensis]